LKRFLIFATTVLTFGRGAPAQEPPRFQRGDLIKVNVMGPDRSAGQSWIYATLAEAQDRIRRYREATVSQRPLAIEGAAWASHNSEGILLRTEMVAIGDESIELAEVCFSAGTLRGHCFWIGTRWLRRASDPDQATGFMLRGMPMTDAARERSWDPEYRPEIGDTVMLVRRGEGLREPISAAVYPGELSLRTAADTILGRIPPVAVEMLHPRAGAKATVLDIPRVMPEGLESASGLVVKLKITSGAFAGQQCWAFREALCRPEMFERAAGLARERPQ